MISQNNLVPPKSGTPIPYTCQNCGENFTQKKSLFPRPVKCPKCGSTKCISPLKWKKIKLKRKRNE